MKWNVWALWSALLTLAIALFYALLIRNQNPSDINLPRVRFIVVFVACTGILQLAGTISSRPVMGSSFLSAAVAGLGGMMVVGAFSIGTLFFVNECLAVPALIESLRNDKPGRSLLACTLSGIATTSCLVAGLLVFPLN